VYCFVYKADESEEGKVMGSEEGKVYCFVYEADESEEGKVMGSEEGKVYCFVYEADESSAVIGSWCGGGWDKIGRVCGNI
jgi:hypothetical protein